MKYSIFSIFFALVFVLNGTSQTPETHRSWNPKNEKNFQLEGAGWPTDQLENIYERLPLKAKEKVRENVWNLSKQTAGLSLSFATNANEIIIQYTSVGGELPHMPNTGVKGLDLFDTNNGKWNWVAGRFKFGDTCMYTFKGMNEDDVITREYTVFLPLYNGVKDLEIFVPKANSLQPIIKKETKPIVVYGTSIAQGACASKPGNAWAAIVKRKLNNPVINLGFSGNGKMEKEVIDLIKEIDASVFVLDCLPNLTSKSISRDSVKNLLVNGVLQIRKTHKTIPILLVEHGGYMDGEMNKERLDDYRLVNLGCKDALKFLQQKNITGIYYLTKTEIGLDDDSGVDWSHPNDFGMMKYANAYIKKLKPILAKK